MSETPEEEPQTNPLWSDDPLGPDDEDLLKREKFVSMVAERLNTCVLGQSSTVFGLVGPWGSGKSSLISKIRAQLDPTWKVAVYSPWASADVVGLQSEFLAALASVFEDEQGDKHSDAKAAVRKYSKVCTSLFKAIPVAGSAVADAAQAAVDLATADKPWHVEFDKAASSFKDLGLKVLVIADDIDRLDSEEVVSLLKVIRLLGRFPNVHYLVAYDQTTIEELLKGRGLSAKAAAFMEKIVQYPFEVPPIAGVVQRRLFTKTIDDLIKQNDISLDTLDSERLSELVSVLAPALITPRAQTRFREQLLSFAGMLSFDEIDSVDYVALSFVRVFYHDVYEQLPAWKGALQSGTIPLGFLDSSDLSDDDWYKLIRPLVNRDDDALLAKALLSSLFPGIQAPGLLMFREHPLALSNDLYFERYFILGIAEDDVEDRLISNAVIRIIQGDLEQGDVSVFAAIIDSTDAQRAALALEKGHQFRGGETGGSPALVRFLLDRLAARPEEDDYFASPKRALRRWLDAELLIALKSENLTIIDLQGIMSSKELLSFIVRSIVNRRIPDSDTRTTFGGLEAYLTAILESNLISALDSGINLPQLVDVCWWLRNGEDDSETLVPIGSKIVETLSENELERVIIGFVNQENWVGSDGLSPELGFQNAPLRRLFNAAALRQIAAKLPANRQLAEIDTEDVSSQNKRDFALASLAAAV